ncbi:hypothetical protein NHN26_02135 [Rhodovulum tesquicola]|uniref:hypothetical protein n=1 Tax=Rhodovulum tesquicola TaxID=540254 RepID=UPI0020977F49|nr:hypothetical protein [Rhodovulum tesquicola]MCO8144015.1 hypothetical protein [Rhodovulum tesquicola]
MSAWVPITTALIAIFGGALAYWNQKRIDRTAELIAKRRLAYEQYLLAYLRAAAAEGLQPLTEARMAVVLVASDDVLKAVGDLDDYAKKTSAPNFGRDMALFNSLFAKAVAAMRRDVFEKTKLSIEDLKRALPIGE